jgi:Flp pilus assembly protein TadD
METRMAPNRKSRGTARATWIFRLGGVAAGVFLAMSPGRAGADEPTRIVAARVAVDEHGRAHADWEAALRGLFDTVSASYERQFGIRLRVADIVSWTTGSEPAWSGTLLEQLRRDVPAGGVDVVIGFSGRRCGDFRPGWSIPFGPVAVVCGVADRPASRLERVLSGVADRPAYRLERVLSGEIANLFGAYDPKEWWQRGLVDVFDDRTARLIHLMRRHDFARGAVGVDEPTRQRLLRIYRERVSDGWNPLVLALRAHAQALSDAGDRKAAVAQLREVIVLAPTLAQLNVDIGNIHRASGDLHEAMAEFHRALAKDSRSDQALTGLGLIHIQRKALDAAVRELRKAIAVNPVNAPARRALGAILLDRKEYRAAVDMLAGFVEDDAEARLHLALAYQGAGRRHEAWAEVARLRAMGVEAIPQDLIDYITRRPHP